MACTSHAGMLTQAPVDTPCWAESACTDMHTSGPGRAGRHPHDKALHQHPVPVCKHPAGIRILEAEYELRHAPFSVAPLPAGIKTKSDVLAMGIDKYNEECRSIVMRYSKDWEHIVHRLGRWIDFEVRPQRWGSAVVAGSGSMAAGLGQQLGLRGARGETAAVGSVLCY
jgi:hypothetical protein